MLTAVDPSGNVRAPRLAHWLLRFGGSVMCLAACQSRATDSRANQARHATEKPVTLSATPLTIHGVDSVTFVATLRPDIARLVAASTADPDTGAIHPHIVGWFWVPDLVGMDPWTKGCVSVALTCRTELHGDGTMVFSVRVMDQICADWVHIEEESIPDVDERDSSVRKRRDSVNKLIRTKSPMWERCSL
ncbi:MAG TPA: hypothetical protein VN706_16800 [Gemmatimonadaceae bacterium]|nr:hypothetical protein [Gemmatimonadaceae bacterium]